MSQTHGRSKCHARLTPGEDAIGDPDDASDEIDDLLPGDLWFALDHQLTAPNPAAGGRGLALL